MLIMSSVVIGKYNLKFSFSILISPGSLPIQESLSPKKYIIVPINTIISPAPIIYFPFIMASILIR